MTKTTHENPNLPSAPPPGSASPWDFACSWYRPEEIGHFLSRQKSKRMDQSDMIPEDIYSMEFRDWLTNQYRLAMNKGIEIGQRWTTQNTKLSGGGPLSNKTTEPEFRRPLE